MRDLVGASIDLTVEPDTRLDGFVKVGASRTAVSPLGTELYQKAAYQAVDAIWRTLPSEPCGSTAIRAPARAVRNR